MKVSDGKSTLSDHEMVFMLLRAYAKGEVRGEVAWEDLDQVFVFASEKYDIDYLEMVEEEKLQ